MLAQRGVPLWRQVMAVERPVVKINLPPQPKKSKRSKVDRIAVKTLLRRRAHYWRILGAIAELLPRDADVDGRATGTLSDRDISKHLGLSGKAVSRAMQHWRDWRVLGLFWKGDRVRDIRFERQVVDQLLATWATEPRKVGIALLAHKAKREAAAPWPRAPKKHNH